MSSAAKPDLVALVLMKGGTPARYVNTFFWFTSHQITLKGGTYCAKVYWVYHTNMLSYIDIVKFVFKTKCVPLPKLFVLRTDSKSIALRQIEVFGDQVMCNTHTTEKWVLKFVKVVAVLSQMTSLSPELCFCGVTLKGEDFIFLKQLLMLCVTFMTKFTWWFVRLAFYELR